MKWNDVNDCLPTHYAKVIVIVNGEYGIADYDQDFGFEANDSAYDIKCDDDSGLTVSFDGKVCMWSYID